MQQLELTQRETGARLYSLADLRLLIKPLSAEERYQETLDRLKDQLVVGDTLPDDVDISFTGNYQLLHTDFTLRSKDLEPIDGVPFPGKSAHIAFTEDLSQFCEKVYRQPARQGMCLYTVPVGELRERELHPLYAPVSRLPLHVRVVHNAHFIDPNRNNISQKARQRLVHLLSSHRVDYS